MRSEYYISDIGEGTKVIHQHHWPSVIWFNLCFLGEDDTTTSSNQS